MAFSLLDIAAVLLTLSALFGWLNHKFLPLPHSVGLLVMGAAASLVIVAIDAFAPSAGVHRSLSAALLQVDFSDVVMNFMLAFLLFAGSLHVDLSSLKSQAVQVAILACVGTLASTAVVGCCFWLAAQSLGHPMSFAWALVFGALISPTDPVAVLTMLKNIDLPASLKAEMQGESLFNDGVGIVLFAVLLIFAVGGEPERTTPLAISELLLIEAGGGLLLGLVTGYVAYWGMRLIDDYPIEVLISLALVTGTYAIAERLHVSGPLSMVSAGLLIGDRGARFAMSERTKTYMFGLWTLIDEILNSVLFLLIGLEVLVLRFEALAVLLAVIAIPIVLLGRLVAVGAPPLVLAWTGLMSLRNVPLLTWGGVRGGISVALALSIPEGPEKPAILAATYAVVLFSLIVQGTTLGIVARRTVLKPGAETTGEGRISR